MNKILKFSIMIVVVFFLLSAVAAMFHICPPKGPWIMPPWCEGFEIKDDVDTDAVFFVSVPYNTPEGEIYLEIDGREPIMMDNVGYLSYQATAAVKGQETLTYNYKSSAGQSKKFTSQIKRRGMKIDDGVSGWQDLNFDPALDIIFGINMMDTWGRNYNFMMIENTRDNIDASFSRVSKLGAKEVVVHDFLWATYDGDGKPNVDLSDMDYIIEPDIFLNDHRDEGMTQEDMDKLAQAAHDKGLKINWRVNLALNNIGAYVLKDISKEVAVDWATVTSPKTKEWVEDFLDKWEKAMLQRADMLNKAGFDMMIINPTWHYVTYQPHEDYANQRWKEIIAHVKERFDGKVGYQINIYGLLGKDVDEDWEKYDFYKDADNVFVEMQYLPDYGEGLDDPTVEEMKSAESRYLDDLESAAKEKGIKLSLLFGFASFENAFHTRLAYHPEEYYRDEVKAMKSDWQHQADAYEAFFQALEGRQYIERALAEGYWWDDASNPEDTNIRLDLSMTTRNKLAEGVVMKWGNAIK